MAGYTRQSTFADGDTITAALFNNEYNQLLNAFNSLSGHKHDGTTGEGAVIALIGDTGVATPLNKVLIDSTNDHIEFWVDVSSSSVQQLYIADGAIVPVTDNDIDLGTSSLQFKDLYINGTATIDILTVDEAATIGTTLGVTGATTLSSTLAVTGTSTLTGNVTTTNDLSVGGNLTVTGNATISGNLTFGDADTDSINLSAEINSHIVPNTSNTYDLGTSSKQWRNIFRAGTLHADAINFNGTAITATAAELNILDGVTSTAAELNILDGKAFLDEDNMASNSATGIASQQSIKAYVDAQVTAQDLDITTDSGTIAIDLDSENLTVSGGTGLDSSATGNAVTLAIDSTVTTLTGTQTLTNKTLTTPVISSISNTGTLTLPTSTDTLVGRATTDTLTNKTLTSPVINTGVSGTAFLDDDTFATATASTLASSESIKAYVDTTVAATNEVVEDSTPQLGGDLDTNGNDILFADNDKAIFGAGSDLQIYHDGSASYVSDQGTGNLKLLAGSFRLRNAADTENIMQGNQNGTVSLYYDNSIKFATSSTGIDVTGTATMDSLTVDGNILLNVEGNELQFNTSSTPVNKIYTDDTYTSNGLTISADNGVTLKSTNNYLLLDDTGTNEMVLNVDGGERMRVTSTGIDVTGTVTADGLTVNSGTTNTVATFQSTDSTVVIPFIDSVGSTQIRSIDGEFAIRTGGDAGSSGGTLEHFRIDGSGNVGIGTTGPSYKLHSITGNANATSYAVVTDNNGASGTTVAGFGFANGGALKSSITAAVYGNDYMTFNVGGSGTTERARIDSSGNVGIGTGISGAVAPILRLGNAGTSGGVVTGTLSLGSYSTAFGSNIISSSNFSSNSSTYLAFGTTPSGAVGGSQPTERMRIDSSGNLLVGKTVGNIATTGVEIDPNGILIATKNAGTVAYFNRLTNDGAILDFRKDGSTVGNIASKDGDITIGTGDTGLRFNDAYDAIYGANSTTQAGRDASIDLGMSTQRFKDLYLSGTAYVGTSVGIGTTSVDRELHLKAANPRFRIEDSDGGYSEISANGGHLTLQADAGNTQGGTRIVYEIDADEKMRIDSLGNVGIGTTNPQAELHVEDASGNCIVNIESATTGYSALNLGDTNNDDVGQIKYDNSNNSMQFTTNASEAMRIDSSGNVGIGTDSPQKPLHINSATGNIGVRVESTDATSSIEFMDSGTTSTALSARVGGISDDFFVQTNGSERMRIDSSGNVGIGTDSPSEALHVYHATANINAIIESGDANAYLAFKDNSTSSSASVFLGASANDMTFFAGGTDERMRIDSSGNVLVGTTSDSIAGANTTGVVLSPNSAAQFSRDGGHVLDINRVQDGQIVRFRSAGGIEGSISISGSTTSYNTSSDARLKDVTGEARGLEVINELNPVAYNWKADGKADEGLIAQEVQEIVPNAVSGSEEEMYQMDYSKLVVHLVKGMKEQQTQIEALQSEINLLKGE